ncbi:MAG: acyl-CoA dehydrogenase family protein [Parvibaculales bacterium]
MSVELTEEQGMIQDMAAGFAADNMAPHAAKWDEEKHFPVDVLRASAELGFASIYTSEEFGGSGLSRFEAVLIFEQLSKGCPTVAAYISIHNMVTWMIDRFGSDELRAKYIPSLTTMDKLASYCLTEPGAGSDAGGLKTKAVRDGDVFKLSGTKQFISGAGASDVYLIMARTGDDGAGGVSAFLVDKDTPGLSFGANEKKMGWNAQPTRQVIMDDVAVPAAQMIGAEGDGFKIAMMGLDGGRLNIAACSLGGAQSALEQSLDYVKERKQFNQTLAQMQNTQFKLADMEIDLQSSRLMLYTAAQKLDAKTADATPWCAMAKRLVTDKCFDVANQALQLHGGYGYLSEYNVERIVRDLRVHQILEGTNEIMRVIIARHLLK